MDVHRPEPPSAAVSDPIRHHVAPCAERTRRCVGDINDIELGRAGRRAMDDYGRPYG